MAGRCPAVGLRRPVLAGGVVGAGAGQPSGAAQLRHTDEGERFDDFAIRQQWWSGEALPEATVVRRELAGVPRIEVVGSSKDKVEELFWDTVTQVRAELAGRTQEIISARSRDRWKEIGHGDSTLPPWCVMMPAWIHAPWNGWATTS